MNETKLLALFGIIAVLLGILLSSISKVDVNPPRPTVIHVTNTVYVVETDHIQFEDDSLMQTMETKQ